MRKKIKTKITEIASALGAEPAEGTVGLYFVKNICYSFDVIKLTTIYPIKRESGLLLSIVIDGEIVVECGFHLPVEEIVKRIFIP